MHFRAVLSLAHEASRLFDLPVKIKGMEEGMHSMRVGGKRRVIMPQDLGYTIQGLGPYPAEPRNRDVLIKVSTPCHIVEQKAQFDSMQELFMLEVTADHLPSLRTTDFFRRSATAHSSLAALVGQGLDFLRENNDWGTCHGHRTAGCLRRRS